MPVDLRPSGVSKTAALTALAAVAERWELRKTERHLLLGVPESTANHWFSALSRGVIDEKEVLAAPLVERISHIVSVYDLLHRIVKGKDADRWIERPNDAFAGQAPRELLLTGRADDLLRVRGYLERIASQ